MQVHLEAGAWLCVALAAYYLCRLRFRIACFAATAGGLLSVPLILCASAPEASERVADFLSREWSGAAFGAAGGLFTGASIAAVLCLPRDRNRPIAVSVFIIAGLWIALSERKSEIFQPFPPTGENAWKDGVCLQTTDATYGPASLATCLRALGISATERSIAIDAHTAADGTLFADLAKTARRRGAIATFHEYRSIAEVPLPAIASITLPGGIDHFVAILSRNGERLIADPLNGIHTMKNTKYYEWSGMFLSLSTQSSD